MRQKNQTPEDAKFRTALESMRYKACTPTDIAFLQTLISSPMPGQPSVCDDKFRDISIITALNVHKDEINKLGSEHFAAETGQVLTHFYSEDTQKVCSEKSKFKGSVVKLNKISDKLQQVLWNWPYSTNDRHIAGTLSLCKGLPVMIRYNDATELDNSQ
jgi:hypothetical protein